MGPVKETTKGGTVATNRFVGFLSEFIGPGSCVRCILYRGDTSPTLSLVWEVIVFLILRWMGNNIA